MLLVVIIMFYNVLWGFSINPPYFGYNSAEQENPVLQIFKFHEPSKLKLTWDFWSANILSREAPGGEEVNEMRPRGRTSTGGVATYQAAPPILVEASSLQHRQSSSLDAQLNLTTPIYRPP
jgi:hypothetical protein